MLCDLPEIYVAKVLYTAVLTSEDCTELCALHVSALVLVKFEKCR